VRREGDEEAGEPPLPPSLRWLAIEENEGAAPQESPTRRRRAQGIEVEFTEGAVGLVAEEGFDSEFGARPLRRTIQRRVENELASMFLSGSLDPGDRVVVGAHGEAGGLTFEVVAGEAAAETPGEGEGATV
jgi:ATP-dependent Clp protease ATP-binding subunit ClpC